MTGREMRPWICLLYTTFGLTAGRADDPKPAPLPPATDRAVTFDADVKPIFITHCYKCHGGGKAKGGLRLDEAKAA